MTILEELCNDLLHRENLLWLWGFFIKVWIKETLYKFSKIATEKLLSQGAIVWKIYKSVSEKWVKNDKALWIQNQSGIELSDKHWTSNGSRKEVRSELVY